MDQPTAPTGYALEALSFGQASAADAKAFLRQGLWDPTKARSRMKRILEEAAEDPAKLCKLALAKATDRAGNPAGLYMLEASEASNHPAELLKNPFRSGTKPSRRLDKTFRAGSWFMAYTLPEHRSRGLAAAGAKACEAMEISAFPPSPGCIPLVRAVEKAYEVWDRAALESYPCRHLPSSVNFALEAHYLTQRFMTEACQGDAPVFGRLDLAGFTIEEIGAKPRPFKKP